MTDGGGRGLMAEAAGGDSELTVRGSLFERVVEFGPAGPPADASAERS